MCHPASRNIVVEPLVFGNTLLKPQKTIKILGCIFVEAPGDLARHTKESTNALMRSAGTLMRMPMTQLTQRPMPILPSRWPSACMHLGHCSAPTRLTLGSGQTSLQCYTLQLQEGTMRLGSFPYSSSRRTSLTRTWPPSGPFCRVHPSMLQTLVSQCKQHLISNWNPHSSECFGSHDG